MRQGIRAAMVAVLVFCGLGVVPMTAIAQGNVVGNVYTSPTFGYQLQWSDPWVFIEESQDAGADYLLLSSGTADATFLLTFAPGLTVDDVVTIATQNPQAGARDIQPMLDAQGNPVRGTNGVQEWAVYTGTQDLGDGTSVDFMQYFNVHPLDGGVVLLMSSTTVSYFYQEVLTLASWNDLANTVLVGGTTGPVPAPTETAIGPTPPAIDTPTPIATATTPAGPPLPDQRGSAGEPAPAFAVAPWRIAVRAVDVGESIDYLGLGFVDGQQWVVVYADVTNWSDIDVNLRAESLTLSTANGLVPPDTASTQSTASLLGLEPANGDSVLVPAGGSIRVALVYSIPIGEGDLILDLAGYQLPLEDAVGQSFDVTDLSTIATPPSVVAGTLRTLPDDGSGYPKFVVDTGAGEVPVQLAGVSFAASEECAPIVGDAVEFKVEGIAGPVWLETDPAFPEQDTYYIWIEDESGNRMLINQFLIANGLGFEGDVPEAARFGAWLEQTEEIARSNKQGIWVLCS